MLLKQQQLGGVGRKLKNLLLFVVSFLNLIVKTAPILEVIVVQNFNLM